MGGRQLAPSQIDKFLKIPSWGWVVRGRGLPGEMIALGDPTESQM